MVIVVVLFISCKEKRNKKHLEISKYKVIKVTIPQKDTYLLLTEIAEKLEFIKLETCDSALFSKILKVGKVRNNYVLLTDRGVFMYDSLGNYINKIRNGRGPGELIFPMDIIITEGDKIEVLDYIKKTIQVYNKKMEYIETIKLPLPGIQIENITKKIYLIYSGNVFLRCDHLAYVYDVERNMVLKQILPLKRILKKNKILTYYNLNKQDSIIYINSIFSDTVYILNKTFDLKPALVYDYGPYKLPNDYYENNNDKDIFKDHKYINAAKGVRNLHISGNIIISDFNFKNNSIYRAMYNRKSGRILSARGAVWLIKDYVILYPAWPIGKYEEGFIFSLSASKLLDGLKKYRESVGETGWKKYIDGEKGISKLFNQTFEGDNPILVFAKLK